MNAALFDLPGRPRGVVRAALDARVAQVAADGAELPGDLVLVTASLADRIDAANAGAGYRGYVMLTAEYRAAVRDLFDGVVTNDGGLDPLAAALADFRAAQVGNPPEPVPAE